MTAIFKKYPTWSLVLLGLIMILPGFAVLDVSIMEARNLITAREMITDNNWIMTTMNGQPRYQKPPLPTWLTAIFMLIGGSNLFWLRLPGIIMIGLCGNLIYRMSKAIGLNNNHSLGNALIGVTSFYVVAIVVEAPWDIYAHVFMGFSILFLLYSLQKRMNPSLAVFLSSVFFGCSVLSKGPVSAYALMLPFILAFGLTYGYDKRWRSAGKIMTVILAGLILGGWWYLIVRINDPISFENMASRETGNWSSYNVRPFYYYWSFFTQSGIWTIPALMGLIYPYMIKRVENKKAYRFTWLWTIIAVVLLSMIPEKKSRYLMPVLVPLAINTGFYIRYIRNSVMEFKNKAEIAPIYLHLGILGLVSVAFPAVAYFFLRSSYSVNWWHVGSVGACMLILGILTFRILYRKKSVETVNLMLGLACAMIFLLMPLGAYLGDGNYKPLTDLRETIEKDDMDIFQTGDISPEFIWQYGDKIPEIKLDKDKALVNSIYVLSEEAGLNGFNFDRNAFRLVRTFDLNRFKEEKGNYRERLKVYLYLVSPK